jgi:hypothetical protein
MYDNFVALESAQIVDSGSTADGDYWRFEDGVQIVINSGIASFNSDAQINVDFNFPVNFISGGSYSITANAINSNSSLFYCAATNTSSSITTIYTRHQNSAPQTLDIDINYIAIGRWK